MTSDPKECLALSKHADLKHRHHGSVLVLPEHAIRLAGSGAEILGLCNGQRDRSAIHEALAARYPDTEDLAVEVDRFLTEMTEMGGLESVAPNTTASTTATDSATTAATTKTTESK